MSKKVRLYVGGVMAPCLRREIPWWLKVYVLVSVAAMVGTNTWSGRPSWFAPLIGAVAIAVILGRVVQANIKGNRVTAPLRKGRLVCWQCGYDLGNTPSPGACPKCQERFEADELWRKWATTPYARLKSADSTGRAT
jgi:hypothetical protein